MRFFVEFHEMERRNPVIISAVDWDAAEIAADRLGRWASISVMS